MDLMQHRRSLLMAQGRKLDTTPKIAEYGKYWNRTFGSTSVNANWCITDWYDVVDTPGESRITSINGYIGTDATTITFQYYLTNGTTNWYYFAGTNPRRVIANPATYRISKISFSIQITEIDNSYAVVVETGQILFAGKNTQYYGHRNISDLS